MLKPKKEERVQRTLIYVCPDCSSDCFPQAMFFNKKTKRLYRRSHCTLCEKERVRETVRKWRMNNPEAAYKSHRAWISNNKKQVQKYHREYMRRRRDGADWFKGRNALLQGE